MFKPLILVVDDDKRIRELLAQFLSDHAYKVQIAASAAQARSVIASLNIDLIILDVMMPNESGLTFLKSIRNKESIYKNIPVILLTAQDGIEEKINGLMSGADDYLTKPFEPKELVARIQVILRRIHQQNMQSQKVLKLGEMLFNIESGIISHNQKEIQLTSSELMLLRILSQQPQQAFTRSDLAQRVGFVVSERSIDVQINRLRRKINDVDGKYIRTIRHLGYSLCPLN